MTHATRLHFQDPPGLLSQYSRALLARGGHKKTGTLPALEVWQTGVRPAAGRVDAYARVCGFPAPNGVLPLTYPHILAFPLHMELMLHRDFPLPLMGLVHISNRIVQHRAIRLQEKLDIHCCFSELRTTRKGTEFSIRTEISCAGEVLWESVSTNLHRNKSPRSASPRPAVSVKTSFPHQENWQLSSDLGRRYARVSGDSNPIHLFALSARLFGFPRHIAHGMWCKARAAATLAPLLQREHCELMVDFRLPVFLPGQVTLHWDLTAQEGGEFELRSPDSSKTHLTGSLRAL